MRLRFGLIVALLLAIIFRAQEPVPIRVPVRLVLVPTLVFSARGKIVSGLEARDFSLADNGVWQHFEVQTQDSPASIAIVIQSNSAVNAYLPFIKKTGTLLDSLLVGDGGRSAILTYDDKIEVLKPFGDNDSSVALAKVTAQGSGVHMLDAGMQAVHLLKEENESRSRVLLLIGQASDEGSDTSLEKLKDSAARENVVIHCLTLPILGKKFVADTFSLLGKNEDLGGFVATVDLIKLVPAMRKAGRQAAGVDPFSVLASATGGTQVHFRSQQQLENDLIAIGTAIRSAYLLTYAPHGAGPGYHALSVTVNVPGDKVYSRPGYWRDSE